MTFFPNNILSEKTDKLSGTLLNNLRMCDLMAVCTGKWASNQLSLLLSILKNILRIRGFRPRQTTSSLKNSQKTKELASFQILVSTNWRFLHYIGWNLNCYSSINLMMSWGTKVHLWIPSNIHFKFSQPVRSFCSSFLTLKTTQTKAAVPSAPLN